MRLRTSALLPRRTVGGALPVSVLRASRYCGSHMRLDRPSWGGFSAVVVRVTAGEPLRY